MLDVHTLSYSRCSSFANENVVEDGVEHTAYSSVGLKSARVRVPLEMSSYCRCPEDVNVNVEPIAKLWERSVVRVEEPYVDSATESVSDIARGSDGTKISPKFLHPVELNVNLSSDETEHTV